MQVVAEQLKRWFAEPVESVFLQVPRALAASCLSAGVDISILLFLVSICGWDPKVAAIAGYFGGGVLQYILCSLWVFPNSPDNPATGFLTFLALSLVGLAITYAV